VRHQTSGFLGLSSLVSCRPYNGATGPPAGGASVTDVSVVRRIRAQPLPGERAFLDEVLGSESVSGFLALGAAVVALLDVERTEVEGDEEVVRRVRTRVGPHTIGAAGLRRPRRVGGPSRGDDAESGFTPRRSPKRYLP
jgi:hypothetical protein